MAGLRWLGIGICIVQLWGCTYQQMRAGAAQIEPVYPAELVSGSLVFGAPVSMQEAPVHDVLAVTPQMREFVGDISERRITVVRFSQLLKKLYRSGFFENRYDATVTQTAAETFTNQVGNCISYTNLFVALARLADLTVSYQIVELDHPSFSVDSGLLIRNNHINVLVQGPRFDPLHGSGYTIDFNLVDPDPEAKARKVSDAYARSLFYANLSVDRIVAGEERLGFAYLQRAIDAAPHNPDVWINLGAFYNRHGQFQAAIQALQIAGQITPNEKIVLSGLERSYRNLGDYQRADELAKRVQRYRQNNPYFHFAVAQTAYEASDFQLSLDAIERALRLKSKNPRFHYMKSLVLAQLGDTRSARASLARAERYGRYDDLMRRYGLPLASLEH